MPCYSPEIKATALKRMQPPINDSISVIASSMNIASATLYKWRDTAKKQRQFIGRNQHNDPYDPQTKLNAIIHTAALNQTELSAYCREHGLYPEQLQQWRQDMLSSLSHRVDQIRWLTFFVDLATLQRTIELMRATIYGILRLQP